MEMEEEKEGAEEDDDDEEEEEDDLGDSTSTKDGPHGLMEKEKVLRDALMVVSKRVPNNFNCLYYLGLMYFRSQNYQRAKEAFKKALKNIRAVKKKHPDMIKRWNALEAKTLSLYAQCCLYELIASVSPGSEEHNPVKIQESFVQATKIDNGQPDIWNNIGLLHMSLNKFSGARMILKPILCNFTQYNDAIANLGLSHLCGSELTEAARNFQTVILRDSAHLEALNNYGVLLLKQKCYSNAIVFFQKAIDLDSSHSYVWSNLACAYSGAGRFANAAKAFRNTRELDESNIHATSNLAHHITAMLQTEADPDAKKEKFQQAEHMFSNVLSEQIGFSQAWTGLGSLFKAQVEMTQDQGSKDEFKLLATEAFHQAIGLDENDATAMSQLGLLALADGEYKNAQHCFNSAIQKNQGFLALWVNLGLAQQLDGATEESMHTYEKALGISKENHELWNNLGNLYRTLGKTDEALAAYQTCLNIKEDYAIAYNNLALLHILLEDFEAAQLALDRALALDSGLDCAKSNNMKLKEVKRRKSAGKDVKTGETGRKT